MLLIDKPVGVSSFDIIRQLRRLRGTKKMGHAGTLDPLASGLLIVAEGAATKLLHEFLKLPKTYVAEICVGEKSDTGDREGEILERTNVAPLSEETIRSVLSDMEAVLRLPVPKYSAIKQGGEALYKKARRGEHVQVPVREMHVTRAKLLSQRTGDRCTFINVEFSVESGVYVRSLAEEFGRRLGYPARLENLRRTQVGEYRVVDAMQLTSPSY